MYPNHQNRFSRNQKPLNKRRNNEKTSEEFLREIRAAQQRQQNIQPVSQTEYSCQHTFNDFAIDERIKRAIVEKGYCEPSPIQDQAIPIILTGRDLVGIANTGTGKTAAFLIPLIDKVLKNRTERIFIVTPTRELAFQIDAELRSFSRGLNIRSALCIGGTNLGRQINDLRGNPNFVIGTPGRIKDLIQQKVLSLSNFTNVVLDEVDRMVDIGFIEDIRYFISLLPVKRQSLFFSATIPAKAQDIIKLFVTNAVTVSVKRTEAADTVTQNFIKIEDTQKKIEQLHDVLISKEVEKALIFGRTKWGVQKLSDELVRRGFKAGAIHGNKRQNQRQHILEQFKRNEITILLATDVASRGLDIEGISHVINYDIPASYEDYIHRIGRTGRANKKGVALTFV